jgi:hypothetical protein
LKLRPIDVVAFVVGAIIGAVMGSFPQGLPLPAQLVLSFLAPGAVLGLPLAGMILVPMGWNNPAFGPIVISTFAVTNGLCFGLVSYLTRLAVNGKRATFLPVVLGLGVWMAWFVPMWVSNWPTPEPPPMPVDLASPLAGRWEGVTHGARGDAPITLICHPRTDGTLDGFLYASGALMGPLEEGTFAGDSLRFDVGSFQQRGRRDGTQMAIEMTVSGMKQEMELRFVSADTARLVTAGDSP